MARMRRFLQRAELDANEVNILRGILTAVQQRRRRAGAATERDMSGSRAGLSRLRRHHAGRSARGRGDGRVPDASGDCSATRFARTASARRARARRAGARRRSRR